VGILSAAAAQAAMRSVERALPDRCEVRRPTRTRATAGGWTEALSAVATGIPCRVDAGGLTPRERAEGGRLASDAAFSVSLSALPSRWPGGVIDVRATDTLVVTGDGAGTYQPTAPGGPVTDELLRTVPCNRVEE
jgi:hypothetical protein